jgi:hypothetical protein
VRGKGGVEPVERFNAADESGHARILPRRADDPEVLADF